MSIIKDPEYLPVFHHIAKNAGTYVLSWAQMLCRKYHLMRGDNFACKIKVSSNIFHSHWTSGKVRRALIRLKDDRQLTIIYCTLTDLTGSDQGVFSLSNSQKINLSDPDVGQKILELQMQYINTKYPIGSDQTTNIFPRHDFLNFLETGDIIPFCVIVDPMDPGWIEARKYIDLIIEKSERKHALHFTVLRDPYKRAQSLFHYLTSEESAHEPTHDSIQAKNFEDYIQSDEVEDSWFLRNLLDMSEDQVIEPYHLTLAHEWLRHFRISDTSKVDDLINKYDFKLKNTRLFSYHLVCDFTRNGNN